MDSNLLFNSLPTDIRPMVNAYESMTILNLVWTLSKTGYDLRNLAILSPYRSQVAAIIKDLHHLEDGMQRRIDCEVSTVDRFQGRDAEIVIVSTVRSNNNDSVVFT